MYHCPEDLNLESARKVTNPEGTLRALAGCLQGARAQGAIRVPGLKVPGAQGALRVPGAQGAWGSRCPQGAPETHDLVKAYITVTAV